jgi:hypothetical protein
MYPTSELEVAFGSLCAGVFIALILIGPLLMRRRDDRRVSLQEPDRRDMARKKP